MVDLVLNHVSEWHDWFLRARLGDRRYMDYFITFSLEDYKKLEEDGAFARVVRPRDTPLFKEYVFAKQWTWEELEEFASIFHDPEFEERYGNPVEFVKKAKEEPLRKWIVEKGIRHMKYDSNVTGILWMLEKMGKTEKRMVWTTFSTLMESTRLI